MQEPQPNENVENAQSVENDLAVVEIMLHRIKSKIQRNGNIFSGTKIWRKLRQKLNLKRLIKK